MQMLQLNSWRKLWLAQAHNLAWVLRGMRLAISQTHTNALAFDF
jgi:hypothetical protein